MRRALPLVFVVMPLLAWADEPRRQYDFVSANERFVFLSIHGSLRRAPMFEDGRFKEHVKVGSGAGEIWGLFDAHQAVPLEGLPDTPIAWNPVYTLRGDFGSRTVFVGDDGDTVTIVDDFSESEPSETLEVLHFFYDGRLASAYTLGELLEDTGRVHPTVSHFYWFWRESLCYEDGLLRLETTECRRLTFDVRTGRVSKESLAIGSGSRCEQR